MKYKIEIKRTNGEGRYEMHLDGENAATLENAIDATNTAAGIFKRMKENTELLDVNFGIFHEAYGASVFDAYDGNFRENVKLIHAATFVIRLVDEDGNEVYRTDVA